jgi:hypothetical protein
MPAKQNKKRAIDARLVIFAAIFILCAGSMLIVNSLGLPYEALKLRATVALIAEAAVLITAIILIKEKFLRIALSSWLVGIIIWRLYNFSGTVLIRPSVIDVFLIVFYALIFLHISRIIQTGRKQEKFKIWPFFVTMAAIAIPFYFMFVYQKNLDFNLVYIILDIALVSLTTILLAIKKTPSRLFGLFLYAMADATLLWQIRIGTYYVASWVETIFLIAFYVLTVGYIRDTEK